VPRTATKPNQLKVEAVPLSKLKHHPKNPRKGNVELIKKSLQLHGQYRPIVVQRSTNFVLGGNHTLKAAKELKWKTIAAVFVDVDDAQAREIVLMDNKANDEAGYDFEALADILMETADIDATGYSQDEFDVITQAVREASERAAETGQDLSEAMNDIVEDGEFNPAPLDNKLKHLLDGKSVGGVPKPSIEESEESSPEDVDEETQEFAELQAVLEQREEMAFEMDHNYWGIPPLRPDMLVEKLPDKIDTWAGKEATPDDGETTYIFNYGLASASGLPFDRAILSFFTYDYKFENWWTMPAYLTSKFLIAGIKQAIVPDFSFWMDDPRVMHLYNAYRAAWLGRYMQEAGIRVIPRLMWNDMEDLKFCIAGIPKNPPVVAICIQAYDEGDFEEVATEHPFQEIIKRLEPETLLVYSGNPGRRMVAEEKIEDLCKVVYVDNYAAKRRGAVFDKKEGLASIKTKVKRSKRGGTGKSAKQQKGEDDE
jgi:hypothetical protein